VSEDKAATKRTMQEVKQAIEQAQNQATIPQYGGHRHYLTGKTKAAT